MPFTSYLTIDELKPRTVMPDADVDSLPEEFVQTALEDGSSEINTVLRKRYTVPFQAPYPRIILRWLTRIVTPELYERRGWDPSDAQSQDILAAAARARSELQEAANSETGLFELPVRDDEDASAITKGGPFAYSEASPYDWMDRQEEAVRGS